METKVHKLSVDPLAFHMHKSRQFINKLVEQTYVQSGSE